MKNIQLGDVFPTNKGSTVTVIGITNFKNINVRHNDEYGHITITTLQHLNGGNLKNPYQPNVLGVGYIGVGPYLSGSDGRNYVEYDAWRNMLKRCYCPIYQSDQPSYIGCTVDPTWHNYQTFAYWYCSNSNYNKGYHLDKDILIPGNRIYGPQYCTLVPEAINQLFAEHGIISINRELPTGVHRHYSKFQAEYNGIHLGTFDTINDAVQVYTNVKRKHILLLAERYKYDLPENAYYAVHALAYTFNSM